MRLLAAQGLVELRPGAGAYRAAKPAPTAAPDTSWQQVVLATGIGDAPSGLPQRAAGAEGLLATLTAPPLEAINLTSGYLPAGQQPNTALATALGRAGRRTNSWSTPPVEGVPELRDWFAREVGGSVSRSDVLICAGGQPGLALIVRALTRPGDPVVVESPCYPGLLATIGASDARPIPVPVDECGMRADLLRDALQRTGSCLVMVQPMYQNPTGVCLSPQRRDEILAIVREYGAFLVEDDFARYLRHSDAPPEPEPMVSEDPDGRVIHLRSLTKASSPNLRVGAIVARGPVFAHLRAAQVIDSFFVPRPLQEAALELATSRAWPQHLARLGQHLSQLRRLAAEIAVGRLGLETAIPTGGYHLWIRLPPGAVDTDVAAAALRRGVAISPGRAYFPTDPTTDHIRISYCAAETVPDLRTGLERLVSVFGDL